ncbi:MAG: YdcF family protein [Nitrospinota bacterium]
MRESQAPRARARRWPWVALALAAGFALFLWAGTRAGHFLVVDEPPRPADAVVVLGGGEGERAGTAAALYRQGVAPLIIATGGRVRLPSLGHLDVAELIRRHVAAEGVPRGAVRLLPGATGTYEEAQMVRALARREGLKNLLVLSSPYHMRRVRWTFHHVFAGEGVELQFVAARGGRFNPGGWWRREDDLMWVVREYEKLLYYWLAYGWGLRGSERGDSP